jgi:hypothetical protein
MVLAMIATGSVGIALPPCRPGHHEIDFSTTALGADQPLAPIEHRSVRAVSSGHLGGLGLDLMPAGFALND